MQKKSLIPRAWMLLTLLAAALVAMWLVSKCSSPSPLGAAQNEYTPSGGDTIDVAIEYSPLVFYRYGDTIGGFHYEMLRDIARSAGLNLRFLPITDLTDPLSGLADGRYDMVVTDMAVTTAMRQEYRCTEPVRLDRLVLVQPLDTIHPDRMVSSQIELGGKDVWIVAQSPAADRLANLQREIGDTIRVHTAPDGYGSEQLLLMVASGEIPRCVVNEQTAVAMAADYPSLSVNTGISFTQFQAWVLPADTTSRLPALIDSLIISYKSTPAYSALLSKYFPSHP